MTLVLAYPVANMEYYEKYYDNIIIPYELERVHFKGRDHCEKQMAR